MFKNIFPNKLNKLVYKNPETQAAAPEAAEASKESLAEEARQLGASIEGFVDNIQRNLVGEEKMTTIQLNNRDSYANLDPYMKKILDDLSDAKVSIMHELSRSNLDGVRAKIEGVKALYENRPDRLKYDPLRGDFAEFSEVAKAQPEVKAAPQESAEAIKWTRIAKLTKEYLELGDSADDKNRKAEIQNDLLPVLKNVMKGQKETISDNLHIIRAEGVGTEAFKLTFVYPNRKLDQGQRVEGDAVKYTEVPVYIGGSAKDFKEA